MIGKYPLIFLTLKFAKTGDEKSAFQALRSEIASEIRRHGFLLESDALNERDKTDFAKLRDGKPEPEAPWLEVKALPTSRAPELHEQVFHANAENIQKDLRGIRDDLSMIGPFNYLISLIILMLDNFQYSARICAESVKICFRHICCGYNIQFVIVQYPVTAGCGGHF